MRGDALVYCRPKHCGPNFFIDTMPLFNSRLEIVWSYVKETFLNFKTILAIQRGLVLSA